MILWGAEVASAGCFCRVGRGSSDFSTQRTRNYAEKMLGGGIFIAKTRKVFVTKSRKGRKQGGEEGEDSIENGREFIGILLQYVVMYVVANCGAELRKGREGKVRKCVRRSGEARLF